MQNKANLLDGQMNVSFISTKDYENKSNWTLGENKPNSNPIKPKFRKAQMSANVFVTKDYENETAFRLQKNKPNSNPIFLRIKLMQHPLPQRIMKMNHAFGLRENKANQSQFQTGHLLIDPMLSLYKPGNDQYYIRHGVLRSCGRSTSPTAYPWQYRRPTERPDPPR